MSLNFQSKRKRKRKGCITCYFFWIFMKIKVYMTLTSWIRTKLKRTKLVRIRLKFGEIRLNSVRLGQKLVRIWVSPTDVSFTIDSIFFEFIKSCAGVRSMRLSNLNFPRLSSNFAFKISTSIICNSNRC